MNRTLILVGALLVACGAADISEEDARKSERYYQAAYVAWFEEHDNLEAIRHLTRAVEVDPNNDPAHYLLGTIRLGRGEHEDAEKHLRKSLELRGEDRPSARAEAQNSLGVLLITTKRYDEAIEHLTAASKEVLNREPWLALGNLGWAYIEVGEFDKAVETLKRALFDQPRFCVGLYRLGQAYYKKGEHEQALANLESAVAITDGGCDKMQDAHELLGMTLMRLGRDEEAKAAFQTCVDIAPTSEAGVKCASAMAGL